MIRDPSDGSVKEINPQPNENKKVEAKTASEGITGPVIETTTSGLPTPSAKDADRHKRSREWLEDYRAGKIKPKSEETP
jgi:hypothetical protein